MDRTILLGWKTSGSSDIAITAANIEDVAGNHFFDDNPDGYNITEMEGHTLRAFFQEGSDNYNFVIDLHERFSNIMEPEREDYIEKINMRRRLVGLFPLMNKTFYNPNTN